MKESFSQLRAKAIISKIQKEIRKQTLSLFIKEMKSHIKKNKHLSETTLELLNDELVFAEHLQSQMKNTQVKQKDEIQ